MNVASTHAPTLDDVVNFNDTLLSLHEAGVPIGLGTDSEIEPLEKQLSAVNAKIAMSVAKGSTVRQVLDSDLELPSLYRSSLKTWLYCGNSLDALKALSESGRSRRDLERILRFSILHPLILSVLAYFGFLYLLFEVAPKMQSISLQVGSVPGVGLGFLIVAREYLWLCAVIGPAMIVLLLLVWRNGKWKSRASWIPGQKGISESIRKASYADTVSNMLANEYSEEQSLASVGTLDIRSMGGSQEMVSPPLLEWALSDELNRDGKIDALHFAARGYRALAMKQIVRQRSWFPVLVGSLLGGTVVLVFGLCLFGPMIELLFALTRP